MNNRKAHVSKQAFAKQDMRCTMLNANCFEFFKSYLHVFIGAKEENTYNFEENLYNERMNKFLFELHVLNIFHLSLKPTFVLIYFSLIILQTKPRVTLYTFALTS